MTYTRNAGVLHRLVHSTTGLALLLSVTVVPLSPVVAQTSGATPPRPVPAAPVQTEDAYVLGAGDRVRVDLFRVPQYSGEFEVLVNGFLNLPLAGQISVDGLTIEQATAAISQAYSRYLRRPNVTVSLLGRRPVRVGIAGEINQPGSYAVPTNGTQFPTISQVLQSAGGVTQAANVREVQIRRRQRGGTPQVIRVDLWQLIQTGNLSYDVTLRDGDSIFIPETSANLAEAPVIASSSLAPDAARPVNIAIVGEINRPGTYTISGNVGQVERSGSATRTSLGNQPTVTRAIQVAGGIKPMANLRQVQIRRATRSGTEQLLEVNLWDLLTKGDLRQDAILQEGDTIVIPTAVALNPAEAGILGSATLSPGSIRVNVVGEVVRSGPVELPPNTPMNQAILAAGGFNNRARRSRVYLVRLNPDGTASRREITVDLARGIDENGNPALQNNDVILVGRSGLASFSDTLGTLLRPVGSLFSIFELPFRFLRIFD